LAKCRIFDQAEIFSRARADWLVLKRFPAPPPPPRLHHAMRK
jgi:hypothetical protein